MRPGAIRSRMKSRCLGAVSIPGRRWGSTTPSATSVESKAALTGMLTRLPPSTLAANDFSVSLLTTIRPTVSIVFLVAFSGIFATCCSSSPTDAFSDLFASFNALNSEAILSTASLVFAESWPESLASFRASSAFWLKVPETSSSLAETFFSNSFTSDIVIP